MGNVVNIALWIATYYVLAKGLGFGPIPFV